MSRLRARPRLASWILALLTVAVAVWLWRWAVWNRAWGPDEELYLNFARGVARDFGSIFNLDPSYGRGIQRLHLLVWAVPIKLFANPASFVVAHLLFVAIYASATIPAWLIARGCGLGPYEALVPAFLAVFTPWAVVTTSFLAEPIGYGVFAWLVWAIWRAAVRPSLGADALAVALLALAVVARTGFLLMLPVLPAVALLQAWRYESAKAALRRQPLAIGLGLAGVLLVALAWAGVLPGGVNRFTGTYATSLPPFDLILNKWRSFMSRIDAGTGFLMLAAALPWVIARIVRPLEPALHALAWTALLATGSVLFSLVGGPGDERYVMFVAFPVVVAGSVALLRRQLGPGMVLAGGAAALALYLSPGWTVRDPSNFGYFGYPTESFMGRVVQVKLKAALSSVDPRTTGALLLAGFMVVVAMVAWKRRRWLPYVLVPAALFQLAASTYAIERHTNSVGERFGPSFGDRAWVDRNVPDAEDVGVYAVSNGLTGNYKEVFGEAHFWNDSLQSVVKVDSPISLPGSAEIAYPYGSHDVTVGLDQAAGKIVPKTPHRFPRYLVIPQPPLSVVLDWKPVASAKYIPATLVKVHEPPQVRTTLDGVSPDGFTTPPTPALITVYAAARPEPKCVYVDLVATLQVPTSDGPPLRYRVTSDGHEVARGSVPLKKLERVYLPVSFGGARTAQFEIETSGTVPGLNRPPVGLQVGNYEALGTACPTS